MKPNRYTGEVPLDIAGPRTLRYDWSAIARLKSELGQDYEKVISSAMSEMDVERLAKALACGLSPALTAEEVAKASPPILTITKAIDLALKYAYFGGEVIGPQDPDPTLRPKATFWIRLFRSLFGRG